MVEQVAGEWPIDPANLLTGMSDGGTFATCWACAATASSPLWRRSRPPFIPDADIADERLRGLPIHIIHGARLDVPAALARTAEQTLGDAGAEVVYREIADLSHTYPRDENARSSTGS